jgi:exodeoxyribonuclease VII small subunit
VSLTGRLAHAKPAPPSAGILVALTGLTAARPIGYFSRFPSVSAMATASPPTPSQTFESALGELEKIVEAMEAGQLPLDQAIAAYKRGAELLQYCQNALKEATQQVKLLEAGVLKDFGIEGEGPVADRGE